MHTIHTTGLLDLITLRGFTTLLHNGQVLCPENSMFASSIGQMAVLILSLYITSKLTCLNLFICIHKEKCSYD
jgi:hypothetical protein